MTAAGFKVVGIVRGRNFHRAGAEFAIHHFVADDRNLAIHERQDRDFVRLSVGSARLRDAPRPRCPQHGFRPRRRHGREIRLLAAPPDI